MIVDREPSGKDHLIITLRDENTKLKAKVAKLELEIENWCRAREAGEQQRYREWMAEGGFP